MRGLVGFLLLATGLGIAQFELLPKELPDKPAAPQPTLPASPAVGEVRSARNGTVSREPTIDLPSPETDIVSAHTPTNASGPLPKAVKPADHAARRELVRDIQRELAHAGCYAGAITGVWRSDTKRAMSAFLAGVNASLPLDEPDYILLSLVRSDTRPVCMNTPARSVVRAPQAGVPFRSDLPGRMSVGGPVSGPSHPTARAVNNASNSSWIRSRQARRDFVRTGSFPKPRSVREILTHPLANPQD